LNTIKITSNSITNLTYLENVNSNPGTAPICVFERRQTKLDQIRNAAKGTRFARTI